MHYFELNIGDYAAATMHLTALEDGFYFRLLRVYYRDECPISDATKYRIVGARSSEEMSAVDAVLADFFELEDGAWRHRRCERELKSYRDKAARAQANGSKGGRPKTAKTKPDQNQPFAEVPEPETQKNPEVSFGFPEKTQGLANHKPVTSNQLSPIGDNAHTPALALVDCEQDEPPKLRPFDDWWSEFTAIYPRRGGGALEKSKAEQRARGKYGKPGFDPDEVLEGVRRYRTWCDSTGKTNTEFVAQMTTWLNGRRWTEDYEVPESSPRPVHRSAESATQRTQRLAEGLGVGS